MAEEWGPWIEHDGESCPVVGVFVCVEISSGMKIEGVPSARCANPPAGWASAWIWRTVPSVYDQMRVVRYRIRRPPALRRLIDLAADPAHGMPPRFPVEELA